MFDETKHPRDDAGKFTYSNGTEAEQKRMEELGYSKKKSISFEEFFGEEFTGLKGADAIEKLLKEKRGHVKNAFERSEIGGITLVWGNESGGLLHTILRRDAMLHNGTGKIDGLSMARMIPDIVEKGDINIDENDRISFNFNGYRVAIKPSYFDEKINWIVTAMERNK